MIRIKQDKQYLSYILENNANFFPTGYRVLKKQKDKGIMTCSKVNYNGQVKLLYPVSDKENIFSASENWDLKAVFTWMLRLLKSVMKVQENGFLRIEDIDVNLSRIFVNEEEKQVYLVVLPLTSDAEFIPNWNKEFERALISILGLSRFRNDIIANKVKNVIQENSSSLEIMYRKIKNIAMDLELDLETTHLSTEGNMEEEYPEGELHLIARNAKKHVDIAVSKEVFILGKNPKMSDFVIDLSPTISRQHCQIIQTNKGYHIEDLNSLNHTYVNGEMLTAGQRVLIKKGMIIRLAEIEFSIEFRN